MLTKKFKSNKFYEVTRYIFKYGNETDELDASTTVWDTFEKAIAYIERYATGLKFASASIEEIVIDREITADDYKHGDYEYVSTQKIYDVTDDCVEDFTKEKICYFEKSKQINETPNEIKYRVHGINNIYSSLKEAEKDAKFYSRIFRKKYDIYELNQEEKLLCSIDYYAEKEYRIYFGDDRTFGVQTVGLQSALELGQAYAKDHAGEKITVIDENKNTIQEFFEEKKEPVKSNIKAKTNLKSRYLTKKEWDNSHQDFTSWANIGDVVDEETVQHFRDCVSPRVYDALYLQCGEPYTHETNPKTGKWEPAFITFARELGSWVYKGICFYREYEDVG